MEAYWAPFPDDEANKAYQAFPRMFPDSPTHPSFKPMKEIEQGLPRLKIPTLVIWGEKDTALTTHNLEGLDRFVPDLTIKRIPEGSHWVIHEKPAEVNGYIREFIQEWVTG